MAAAGSQGLTSARYGDSPVNTDDPHTGDPGRHMVLAAALYRMAPIIVLSSVWERVLARAGVVLAPEPASGSGEGYG